SDPAAGNDLPVGRRRSDQPGDRQAAGDQPPDRGSPSPQHLRDPRRALAGRADPPGRDPGRRLEPLCKGWGAAQLTEPRAIGSPALIKEIRTRSPYPIRQPPWRWVAYRNGDQPPKPRQTGHDTDHDPPFGK